jgi:hypothetical protein
MEETTTLARMTCVRMLSQSRLAARRSDEELREEGVEVLLDIG